MFGVIVLRNNKREGEGCAEDVQIEAERGSCHSISPPRRFVPAKHKGVVLVRGIEETFYPGSHRREGRESSS